MPGNTLVRRRSSPRRSPSDALIAHVRRFYRDILGCREARGDSDESCGALWFILGRQCITVRPLEAAPSPLRLQVDDPVAVAERCWDAGYTVRPFDADNGDTSLSVIDPSGRRIDLARPDGPEAVRRS